MNPEEKVYAVRRCWFTVYRPRGVVLRLRRSVVVGRGRIVIVGRRHGIAAAAMTSVVTSSSAAVLRLMVIAAMAAAGERRPHRGTADHEAETDRKRNLTDLANLE